MISVIIPVYKTEKYIERCLNSVVHQTYKNLEILLIDDASPDNCPKICDEWAKRDSRIKTFHIENKALPMQEISVYPIQTVNLLPLLTVMII